VKSAAFRALSAVPFGSELHYSAQRYLTRNFPRRPKTLDALWAKAEALVGDYAKHASRPIEDSVFLELGAGRDLAVPIALRLQGVRQVVPIDIERLARLDLVVHAAAYFCRKLSRPVPTWTSWDDVRQFGVDYRAPAQVDEIQHHVDCVCSNEVLEHIDHPSLERIAARTLELARPAGLGIHSIDFGDHFARSDSSIDRFNFLRYDERGWSRHNSRMQFVNRLRPIDFEEIFRGAGWSVRSSTVLAGQCIGTRRDNVAAMFQRYSDRDLFALNGRLVLSAN
jgi:hypothetical protein